MACPPIVLNGVTSEVWECLRAQAGRMGIAMPAGDRGTVGHADADADFVRDAATGTLIVTFTRTPVWIACGAIEARIRQAAATCGAR